MLIPRLIERKRDGEELTGEQWREIVAAYLNGSVPEYQMSALLMAVYFSGMSEGETLALTGAMLESGPLLDCSGLAAPCVDKHSTGGVGDKVSLVLAPLISSLGVAVPMMAGRGLGHTGGTLDKLESIPGIVTRQSPGDARTQLRRIGCFIIGQSDDFARADGRIYALRDATGTVESVPLIAASIMSKKLAESLSGLVLDIKFGAGALIPERERGEELARLMAGIGAHYGCPTVAVHTSMESPLGRAIGNSLEVEEAILALQGDGNVPPDLMDVTYSLGAEMLLLSGISSTHDDAREKMQSAIREGSALRQFGRIVEAQGGNPAVVDDPALLPQANECEVYRAPRKGHVLQVDPRRLGHALIELGGGRGCMTDSIDHSVGFMVTVKPGVWVDSGEPIATVFARDAAGVDSGRRALDDAISIGERPQAAQDHAVPLRPAVT